MLQQSFDYTGQYINKTPEVYDPEAAASWILQGSIPENLPIISSQSNAFRDATLGEILTRVTDYEQLMHLFAGAIRSVHDDTTDLKVYVEYYAAIAFAFDRKDLAGKAIMRMKPQNVGPAIWSIISAMKKQMPSPFYHSLLTSQGIQSKMTWQNERHQHFPSTAVSILP